MIAPRAAPTPRPYLDKARMSQNHRRLPLRIPRAALFAAGFASSLFASGCCSCASSSRFEVRGPAAQRPPAAPDLGPLRLRALHVADSGERNCQQQAVIGGIAKAHRARPFQLAFAAGDNIYDCGPDFRLPGAERCRFNPDDNTVAPGFTPPADPAFGKVHEGPFGLALLQPVVPVYLTIGNHDMATWPTCVPATDDPRKIQRLKACLEVAHQGPLWNMPGRHYVVERAGVRFVLFDSQVMTEDYGGFTFDGELAFLREALVGCERATCFLVAHHPPASAGRHRNKMAAYKDRNAAVLELARGRVRAWLAGHDHDLQHLRVDGFDALVSGNVCRARPDERFDLAYPPQAQILYASVSWGFAELEVREKGWTYRYLNEKDEPLYCCAAVGTGTCEPVRCGRR